MTPILVGFLGVDIKRAVCMGLFFIVFGSFSALLSLSYNGHVDYERGALLAVGGLLGVYFGTSQARRAKRETQKKWLLVLYVVLFALALKRCCSSTADDFAALRFALASVLLQARFKRLLRVRQSGSMCAVLLRRPFCVS